MRGSLRRSSCSIIVIAPSVLIAEIAHVRHISDFIPPQRVQFARPIEAVSGLVNLGLGDATKSVIARPRCGIAPSTPNRQITSHYHGIAPAKASEVIM